VTIAGKTFTLTQSGACTYSISPEQQTLDAAGGTTNVTVTAANGCSWTSTSNAPWLAARSLGPETGTGTVQVTVSANTGAARSGSVTIAGRTFTVNQSAVATQCSYTVDPESMNVNSSSRWRRIDVTAASGCAWTATSNASWIRIGSGASGSGEGEVWIFIFENSGAQRTGTLTIAGQTVTITQRD
jgi:hypothetical protein